MKNEPYIMRSDGRARAGGTPTIGPVAFTRRQDGWHLSISKERSDEFLDTVAEQFSQQGVRVLRFRKPTHTKPARRPSSGNCRTM